MGIALILNTVFAKSRHGQGIVTFPDSTIRFDAISDKS